MFGFVPYILFLIHPAWLILGMLGAMSIPMIVLMKDGKLAAATVGVQPKASLEAELGLDKLK